MKNHNEYVGGVADSWYSGQVGDLWIEYKFIVIPKRPTTLIVPALSSLQKVWCRDRWREGRDVNVIVGSKEGGFIFDCPYEWEFGCTTETFKELMRTRKQLAAYIESRTI